MPPVADHTVLRDRDREQPAGNVHPCGQGQLVLFLETPNELSLDEHL